MNQRYALDFVFLSKTKSDKARIDRVFNSVSFKNYILR